MQSEHEKTSSGQTAELHPLPTMSEVENLTNEMRRMLVRCESALSVEGVKDQAETLERWLESYRRGLSAAHKISENSEIFLHEMRERLCLAMEEMQRLDDEGGAPATTEQKEQVDQIARAIKHIDRLVIALAETGFQHKEEAA